MIFVQNTQRDLSISKSSVKTLVKAALSFLKVSFEEVSVYFVDVKKIKKLHCQFFQDDTPTDCISFPIDEKHLGEIFVCPATALRYAQKRGMDPYKETALYIVHGLLHLIGYDDLDKKGKEEMRKKEKSCMRHLKRLNITLK